MQTRRLKHFIKAPTTRLAATYLGIIMIMSLGFSVVLYNTSSHQLGRQLPPNSYLRQFQTGQSAQNNGASPGPAMHDHFGADTANNRKDVNQFLQDRINEGRKDLLHHLIVLNISALLLGGLISYALARRSLEPIEESMEAQAQFISDASHELRTPLTAIQASNEVFLRGSKPTLAAAKQLIAQNTVDIKRLQQLSDALLNLARHGQPQIKLVAVDVQSLVSDAVTQVVPQASAKSIAIHDKTDNIAVLGDYASLQQVLVILLDNAVKYSDAGTTITLNTYTKAKLTYIQVSDEGVGIRASDMPHLFRRFYRADTARTNSAANGYGLGLAIAKQIIENNHGQIDVMSILGKGSTFSVRLLSSPAPSKRGADD